MLQKTRNLKFCLGTNVGTNHAKIEKILISRAILFGFLHSPVSTIRCEANKINRRRKDRPIGSRSVKLLTDLLLLRARSRAPRCMWQRQTRAPKGEHVSAHQEGNPAYGGGNLNCSVDSARYLAFTG